MVEERRKGMEQVLQRLATAETHLVHGAKRMEQMSVKIDSISDSVARLREEIRDFHAALKTHCEDSETHRKTIFTNGDRIDALESWRDKAMGALKIIGSVGVLGGIIELGRRYL